MPTNDDFNMGVQLFNKTGAVQSVVIVHIVGAKTNYIGFFSEYVLAHPVTMFFEALSRKNIIFGISNIYIAIPEIACQSSNLHLNRLVWSKDRQPDFHFLKTFSVALNIH